MPYILEYYWAGIGSRETPEFFKPLMAEIASILESYGCILRSGGAKGADTFFEDGIKNPYNKEIFRPDYYLKNNVKHYYTNDDLKLGDMMVKEYHPSKGKMKNKFAYKLLSRNTYQLFGAGIGAINSKFVICWTQNGEPVGGTSQAIRMANAYNIPVYNLHFYMDKTAKEIVDIILENLV